MSQKTDTYGKAHSWFQGKRVPLYLVVGGSLAGALIYLTTNRATHPLVESSKSKRQDGNPAEHPDASLHGQKHYESSGRQLTKGLGLHGADSDDPQRSEGIMFNRKTSQLIEGTGLEKTDRPIKKPQP